MEKRATKKIISSVSLILLSIVVIWVGIDTLNKNSNTNLNNEKQITGKIIHTQTIEKPIKSYGNIPFLKLLSIELENSNKKFYTYKASQNYSQLIQILTKGKKVTIHYKQSNRIEANILQLSNSQKIIIKQKNYKEKESFAGIIMIFIGFLAFISSVFLLKIPND